jgi:putative transposase
MSRFVRASHVIWHCQYHVVWVPKYRYRVLQGPVGKEVYKCLMVFCQQLDGNGPGNTVVQSLQKSD